MCRLHATRNSRTMLCRPQPPSHPPPRHVPPCRYAKIGQAPAARNQGIPHYASRTPPPHPAQSNLFITPRTHPQLHQELVSLPAPPPAHRPSEVTLRPPWGTTSWTLCYSLGVQLSHATSLRSALVAAVRGEDCRTYLCMSSVLGRPAQHRHGAQRRHGDPLPCDHSRREQTEAERPTYYCHFWNKQRHK